MRIATFNANSVRVRLPIVLAWLKSHRPDVLCLQETKVVDEEFPAEPFEKAGYHVSFRGEKSYNGVAVVSRRKPTRVQFGFEDGGPADDARLQYVRVAGVHVVNTYVPQGREIDHAMYGYKLEWFDRLGRFFDARFGRRSRVVWVGDLNVAPHPIDLHNPEKQKKHVCFHEDVREAFARAAGWGFVDVFRKHHPEPGQYSWFDYRTPNAAKRNMGWRVDHILATPALANRSTGAFIDVKPRLKEKPSDHTFVAADFDV